VRELQDGSAQEDGVCEEYQVRAASVGQFLDHQCCQRGHPPGTATPTPNDQHQCPAAAEAEQALAEAELVVATGGAP
jgi:uracil-DNA glycosylase